MLKVSAAEFQKNFGRYQDAAMTEPVAVTSYRRERVVLLSVSQYRRLEENARVARSPFYESEVCRELASALTALSVVEERMAEKGE